MKMFPFFFATDEGMLLTEEKKDGHFKKNKERKKTNIVVFSPG